jgi:hypothetical protein
MVPDGPSDFDEGRYYNIIDTIRDEQPKMAEKDFDQYLAVTDYGRPGADLVGEMSASTVRQIGESQVYT